MAEYYNPLNTRLSSEQQQVNAVFIRDYLLAKGEWTLNAICGMLGNFQSECTINPNVYQDWEMHSSDLGSYGYGLPQWTPWLGTSEYDTAEEQRNYHGSNDPTYGRWCIDNGRDKSLMETQLDYLHLGYGGYKKGNYNSETITWSDFKSSTRSANELAKIFYRNYERSASGEYGSRPSNADNWYSYLTSGEVPDNPNIPSGSSSRRKMSKFLLYAVGSE